MAPALLLAQAGVQAERSNLWALVYYIKNCFCRFSPVCPKTNRNKWSFNFDLDFSLDSYYALYLDPEPYHNFDLDPSLVRDLDVDL